MKKRRIKRTRTLLIITICLAVLGIGVGIIAFKNIARSMVLQQVNPVDLSSVKDGTYEGNAKNDMIVVKLKVTVVKNKMTNIDILEHKHGLGGKAEKIVNQVVSNQSLEVDAIAGATYSSNIILKAIENALEKGIDN